MAKNYTLAEAAKIIAEGKDLTAIAELGKRFSLLTVSLASIAALAGDNFTSFVSKFPENITANKVNGWLKNSANVSDDDSDEDEDSTDATDTADEETDEDGKDLDSMTTKELKSLARKMKVFKNAKSSKKEDLIAAIQAANGTASKAKAKTKVEDEEDEDEEETSNPYEGKSAMELFKECKERGIKAAPKKPAKYYVDLLVKADADSADDEDWDDEEEEPAPKKSTSKKAAKKETTKKPIKQTKKPEPEPAEDEDEDGDDWDI